MHIGTTDDYIPLDSKSSSTMDSMGGGGASSRKRQGSAVPRDIVPSMPASVMVQICCPTVTQQFSKAICSAVLTCLPSSSARLFKVATSLNGMAKEPVSGKTEIAMQIIAKVPECPTTAAARMPATAPM